MIDSIHEKTNASPYRICRVLGLPRSSYYAAKTPTSTQCQDLKIGNQIEAIFSDNRRRYGYRRIASELTNEGLVCSHSRVRRLMRERNLIALQPKSYKPCTSDGRADKPSRNLLLDQALPTEPNKVWDWRHHLYSNFRRLALPCRGYRSLFTSNCRLVLGQSYACRPRLRCPQ